MGMRSVRAIACGFIPDAEEARIRLALPNGNAVFFRYWDGRYVLPILQSAEVNAAQLMPVIGRCLINGQPLQLPMSGLTVAKPMAPLQTPAPTGPTFNVFILLPTARK